jgi:hypothetical protein
MLLWGIASFVVGQAALAVTIEFQRPELRDPEYGYKLLRLRQRLAEEPDAPLVLMLGSSRVSVGFCPEALPPLQSGDDPAPVVFNFGLTAAGPVMELLCLKRLLADGIRPTGVIIEVMPPLLNQEQPDARWSDWIDVRRVARTDLELLHRYGGDSPDPVRSWWEARLLPCHAHRFGLLSRYAPNLVPWESRQDSWGNVDRSGWLPYPRPMVTPEEYRRGILKAHREYIVRILTFRVSERADRALRELLELCRDEGIASCLLCMPESWEFRFFYPPVVRQRIDSYLDRLSEQYQVPRLDTRDWIADEGFSDGHHLLASGAVAFTRRLGEEALPRLLKLGGAAPRRRASEETGSCRRQKADRSQ